jgi:hypothetical protein
MNFQENIFDFVKELSNFNYELSCVDKIWNLIFPDQKSKWHHLHVTKYKQTYYLNHIDGNGGGLEVIPGKTVQPVKDFGFSSWDVNYHDSPVIWEPLIKSAQAWLKIVKRNWIKANKRVQVEYPLNRRYGTVSNTLINESLPDIYHLSKELGKASSRKFIRLVEEGYFNKTENTIVQSMTASDYFKYCRIAYMAGKRPDDKVDESLSGKELYQLYADGRHEGLLEIGINSEQEFSDWIDGKHPKKDSGGHPWEIKRGGNTTHIDLSVFRPRYSDNKGFQVELTGQSIGRLKETIQMFLALHQTKIPITIAEPEGIRKRLLSLDNIGIVPHYNSLHRANQHFQKNQDVYDVLYYDELGRYKRRITPFISWEPLTILKPKDY